MTKQELLSDGLERVSQAAKRMGASRNVLYKWIREGRIRAYGSHRCLRVSMADLLPEYRPKDGQRKRTCAQIS